MRPFSFYSARRTADDISHFGHCHTTEEPEFNDLCLPGIESLQAPQRLLERQDIHIGTLKRTDGLLERDPSGVPALLARARPRA